MNKKDNIQTEEEVKKDFSVKIIFQEHWDDYLKCHEVRDVEKQEVEKMLSCKGKERGCFIFHCDNCGREVNIFLGCNSRLCSCCGKRYTDNWADNLLKKVIKGLFYRHIMFTIPLGLWIFVKNNRKIQKIMMDAAAKTIKEVFSTISNKEVTPGIICVLHPFGRDLVFQTTCSYISH